MNIFRKIINYIKNIFSKQEIKQLDAPSKIEQEENSKKLDFINSLKVKIEERKQKRIETLVCEGDGLGIKKKLSV